MTTRELAAILGQCITLYDKRTGATYMATILDARMTYGTLHLSVADGVDGEWFVPTGREADSIGKVGGRLPEVSVRG